MSDEVAIVLAAGKGTRMNSPLPKVLVPVSGRPMIDYVLDALESIGLARILVVVGYGADEVRRQLAARDRVEFVEQAQQLGTGHAVMVCRGALADHEGPVLVVTGDSPMLQASSVRRLFDEFARHRPSCILGTAHKEDPGELGRIVRDPSGQFQAIVEAKDATDQQRQISEVNMSTYLFDGRDLFEALDRVDRNNAQGEYYVTDCPGLLRAAGRDVRALAVLKPVEALSVNTPDDLAVVEAALRAEID